MLDLNVNYTGYYYTCDRKDRRLKQKRRERNVGRACCKSSAVVLWLKKCRRDLSSYRLLIYQDHLNWTRTQPGRSFLFTDRGCYLVEKLGMDNVPMDQLESVRHIHKRLHTWKHWVEAEWRSSSTFSSKVKAVTIHKARMARTRSGSQVKKWHRYNQYWLYWQH